MAIKFIIQAGKERLESNGGLVLGGKIMAGLELDRRVNGIVIDGALEPKITNADVLRSYFGLLILGRTNYEDIELFRHDGYFRRALGIKRVPSSGTLRQRLDESEGRFDGILKEANAGLLNAAALTPVKTECGEYLPMDVDVSAFDNSKSHKEGTGRTYKGTDGYAPNFAYVGAEGYLLNCELRPGTQHCQKGTPEFLRETFELLKKVKTDYPVLLRMDSGNDAAINVRQCRAAGRAYIIKRNLRKESLEEWLETAKIYGVAYHPRPGKTVYIGACYRFMKNGDGNLEPWRIVFEVTMRSITAKGEQLLIPEMAFNTLRRIGQEILALVKETSLAVKEQRWRLRTVLQNIMYLACKYVERSHQHFLRFGQNCQWMSMTRLGVASGGAWVRILYARL